MEESTHEGTNRVHGTAHGTRRLAWIMSKKRVKLWEAAVCEMVRPR